MQIHAYAIKSHVYNHKDHSFITKLINFCTETPTTSSMAYARHLFDVMPEPDIVRFNSIARGYSRSLNPIESFTLFVDVLEGGMVPDHYTFPSLLKACAAAKGLEEGRQLHCLSMKLGLDDDVYVCPSLINMYTECEDVDAARRVFDRILEPCVVSYNAMITGYARRNRPNEALSLFREMQGKSLKVNEITLLSVLSSCSLLGSLGLGKWIHEYAKKHGFCEYVKVNTALIDMFAKCGSLDYARALFDEMSEKDSVTYGAIISGYMAHGLVKEAMALFSEMESVGLSTWNAVISGLMQNNHHEEVIDLFREMIWCGNRPNTVTLSSLLPSLTYSSNLKGGKEIHAFAIRNGSDSNIYVATSIIDNYAKLGYLQGAQRVFDNCRERSLIVWTAIITAYATHGDSDSACSLFNQMICLGTKPDNVTLTALLSACAHSGESDKAHSIFDSMVTKYGIEPGVEHYACMVSVLSRAGKLSDAMEFISKMPVEPIAKVWGALLNGAYVLGDVEIARFAYDHLVEMEPENTGSYTIMANLYTQAGRWEEAEIVRDKMRRIGLKKIPGTSWIDTGKGLRSFIAKDGSCERSQEMYEMIEGLVESMSDKECIMKQEIDETY